MNDDHARDARTRAAYNARATEYIALLGDLEQMAAPDRELISRWRDGTSGRLLDAGCGPGHWTSLLHEADRDVIGIDLSDAFLAAARDRHPAVTFERGSMLDLPVPASSIGGILAWYSIIHAAPAEVPTILAEFARVLVPGGRVLLGFFDGEPGTPFPHAVTEAYLWSVDSLESALADAGFTVSESQRRQDEGHRPHAALIARLAP